MRLYLSPNILAIKYKMNKIAFDWIISTITEMFAPQPSLAHTGDLVGTIAAQSVRTFSPDDFAKYFPLCRCSI